MSRTLSQLLAVLALLYSQISFAETSPTQQWQTQLSSDGSSALARHESGAVAVNGKLYLLGGRGVRSTQIFDPAANTWTTLGPMPLELHHFQPVAIGNVIYVVGAFTCCYPTENLVADVHAFDTETLTWSIAGSMPASRLRGSAAAVVRNNIIYLVGGNTNGHSGGAVDWFDSFDPATGVWKTLPDAPSARDHFSAVLANDYLVAAAGRQTTQPNPFNNAVAQTDVYDFVTGVWSVRKSIPTLRAGVLATAAGDEVIVAGGEINTSSEALSVVEAFNVYSGNWRTLQPMSAGRHSGGGVAIGNQFHVLAGSLNKGGAPETNLHETLLIDQTRSTDFDDDNLSNIDERSVHGTNPGLADSDGDRLKDNDEITVHKTDPLRSDSDADGINDGDEVNWWLSNPNKTDTDDDGLDDDLEVITYSTNPLLADSDEDGLTDAEEVNVYGTNPNNADTDADGLQDGAEVQGELDPTDADTDNDGLLDGEDSDPTNGEIIDIDNPDNNGEKVVAESNGGGGSLFWLFGALVVGRLSPRH